MSFQPPATVRQPGDIQLCPIRGPGGTLIRIGQFLNRDGFADFEHARLFLGDGKFAEAMPGGAVIAAHPLDEPGTEWSTGLYDLTETQRGRICAAARHYVGINGHPDGPGVGYSWLDYDLLALRRLGLHAPGLETFVRSTGRMICSQLVARCWWDGGAPLYDGWTGDVTPGDLHQLFAARRAALS